VKKRQYEKELDGSDNTEPVICFHCHDVQMAHYKGKTIITRVHTLPEGWTGNMIDATCPKCAKLYHEVDQYRREWQAIERRRLDQMKERALRYD
jgi:4-hydroxy-3-methylbut-2-enyl diphosphate reductase IspH